MKCLICGNEAKDITVADFDGESIRCPIDGDYDITDGYRAKLEEQEPADRKRTLNIV